jgi:hypothetical protein
MENNADIFSRFRQSLSVNQTVWPLREAVQQLLNEGYTRESLLRSLEAFRQELQEADLEAAEDRVLEVMDYLVGWCGPEMQL